MIFSNRNMSITGSSDRPLACSSPAQTLGGIIHSEMIKMWLFLCKIDQIHKNLFAVDSDCWSSFLLSRKYKSVGKYA